MDSLKKFDIGIDSISSLNITYEKSTIEVEMLSEKGMATQVSGKCLAVLSEMEDNLVKAHKLIIQDSATVYSRIVKEAVNEYRAKRSFPEDPKVVVVKKTFLSWLFGKKPVQAITPVFQRPENRMIVFFHVIEDCEEKDATQFLNAFNFTNNSGIFCIFIGMGDSAFSLLRVVGGRYENCEFVHLEKDEDLTMAHLINTKPLKKFWAWHTQGFTKKEAS